jgi:hypothetical protein
LLSWLVALTAVSCGGGGDDAPGLAAELRRNQSRWAARNVAAYRYTLRVLRFGPVDAGRPVVIEVRDGAAVSVVAAEPGAPAPDPVIFNRYDTLDKLFDILRAALDDNAERIEARFDLAYGFPASTFIDYRAVIADEELAFEVSRFEAIP